MVDCAMRGESNCPTGSDKLSLSRLCLWRAGACSARERQQRVMPAQAASRDLALGIRHSAVQECWRSRLWVPACAGMTGPRDRRRKKKNPRTRWRPRALNSFSVRLISRFSRDAQGSAAGRRVRRPERRRDRLEEWGAPAARRWPQAVPHRRSASPWVECPAGRIRRRPDRTE